jgi:hypothetical protein
MSQRVTSSISRQETPLHGRIFRVVVSLTMPQIQPEQAFTAWIAVVWHGGGGLGAPQLLPNADAEMPYSNEETTTRQPLKEAESETEGKALQSLAIHRTRVINSCIVEQVLPTPFN